MNNLSGYTTSFAGFILRKQMISNVLEAHFHDRRMNYMNGQYMVSDVVEKFSQVFTLTETDVYDFISGFVTNNKAQWHHTNTYLGAVATALTPFSLI